MYKLSLKQHKRLDAACLNELSTNLAGVADSGGVVGYGTMFSGSDLIVGVLGSVSEVWSDMFGRDVEFRQKYLVEKDEWKRNFCQEHWNSETVFSDLIELEKEDWIGYDERSRQCIPVPWATVNVAGFECDSISSCNQNRVDNQDCIERGEDKTGSTAAALLSFTLARRPLLSWWENVKLLRGKQLAWLVVWCLEHGFLLIPNLLCALSYGAVCRRERQWMLVVDVMQEDSPVTDCVKQAWSGTTQRFEKCLKHLTVGQSVLEAFLLPSGHEVLENWQGDMAARRQQLEMARAKAKAKSKGKAKAKPKPKPQTPSKRRRLEKDPALSNSKSSSSGAEQHLELFLGAGLEWPPLWSLAPELDKASMCLPDRMRDIIFYQTHLHRDFPGHETVHDVNMSISWSGQAIKSFPCIVCSSTMWLRKERRQVNGVELLAVQGVPFHK